MKTEITNELVYYTAKKERYMDFSGEENSLPLDIRMDFLSHYEKAARRWYGDDDLMQKACTEEMVTDFMSKYKHKPETHVRKELHFDKMDVQTAYKAPLYNNLHLYCGAFVEENKIVLGERFTRPTPCAKIEIELPEKYTVFSAKVYIPSSYKCPQNKAIGDAQPGRIIELRCGTLDVTKVKFYNTGEVVALYKDKWRPEDVLVGNILFDQWNLIEINVEDTVTISVNGKKTQGLDCTYNGAIDNIFFDGSMFPYGTWKVKDIKINCKEFNFEINKKTTEIKSEPKTVSLPYAIGGEDNKDCRIYLTKRFDVETFSEGILKLDTLDPCGKVWLNGNLILDADDFMEQEIVVTDYLKEKDNVLEIMVEPRPPEVYYFWHRHNDSYNGWFCGEVSLILTERTHIDAMEVITTSVEPTVNGTSKIYLNNNFSGFVELYAQKIYPDMGEEEFLCKSKVSGKELCIDFEKELELWNTDKPVLYGVSAILYDENDNPIDDFIVETGFRTIEQKGGSVYLNNKKVLLNGALLMQFLPEFKNVPVNHNCPTTEEIVMQAIMLKNMNGKLMRLHMLGYGTGDSRYARICDRLGIMLIWTTRLIDSLEMLVWDDKWHEEKMFARQIKKVINYPSVIMYEGSNEYHSYDLDTVDRMYDRFTQMIDRIDATRLLSPCSHLYYGGGIYEMGCKYYNDDGTMDELGNSVNSGDGWKHSKVVRSCHPYDLLGGYGASWEVMRKQDWKWQDELFTSKKHCYLATEYAVTALPNPSTPEAKMNLHYESYERPDEIPVMGRTFTSEEWKESQALQALYAFNATKELRIRGIDGLNWCCLMSGANNGSYMKPPIDFYGYKKLGFYALKSAFRNTYACKKDLFVSYGIDDTISVAILHEMGGKSYDLIITVTDEEGNIVFKELHNDITTVENTNYTSLFSFKPKWEKEGYYDIKYELKENIK